jgi:hypothetical protein
MRFVFAEQLGCGATAGLLLEIEISEQAPWRKVGLEQRLSGSGAAI